MEIKVQNDIYVCGSSLLFHYIPLNFSGDRNSTKGQFTLSRKRRELSHTYISFLTVSLFNNIQIDIIHKRVTRLPENSREFSRLPRRLGEILTLCYLAKHIVWLAPDYPLVLKYPWPEYGDSSATSFTGNILHDDWTWGFLMILICERVEINGRKVSSASISHFNLFINYKLFQCSPWTQWKEKLIIFQKHQKHQAPFNNNYNKRVFFPIL